MTEIGIFLLYSLSLLLIWQFTGYPLLMTVIAMLTNPKEKNYTFQPFISIVVPAYNEEKYIERRIINLLNLDYPKNKYEIIVVESGSTDNTYRVLKNFVMNRVDAEPRIDIIRESERRGMPSAINLGIKHARGDIILTTSAHCVFDKNALKEVAPHFEDDKIGAVTGRYVALGQHASPVAFYWNWEHIIRLGESVLESACLCTSELNAWRKGLAYPDARIISDDLDIPIKVRKGGYKIVYEPNAIVYETAPTIASEIVKERKRNAIGTLQCIFKHIRYLIIPKNLYNLIIFPSHKALPMFSPFILLAILVLCVSSQDTNSVVRHLIIITAAFIAFSLLVFGSMVKLLKSKELTINPSLPSILRIVHYVLLNEYSILSAWMSIQKNVSVAWEKVIK